MRFDPDNDLFTTYPALKRRQHVFDDEGFLKFLIYMLAPDSPFRDEKDLDLKVNLVLEKLGLTRDSDVFARYELLDEDVHEQMFALFQLYGDHLFETWISYRLSFGIMNRQLRDVYGLKPNDRTRVMREIDDIMGKLLELEEKIFPEDQSIKDAISQRVSDLSLAGYAEQYALKLD